MAVAHRLAGIDWVRRITFDHNELGLIRICSERRVYNNKLRHAVRAGDKVAIGVGREQRTIMNITVVQLNAQQVSGLYLDVAPS